MKTLEYRTIDKSPWGAGPWDIEPDKMQWRDEATGLPCLIVRNHGGAWCGYVGVADGHPLYRVGYSDVAKLPKETLRQMLEARGVLDLYADDLEKGDVRVESIIDVHGGLTFSDDCGEHTREDWEQWRNRRSEYTQEAAKYPRGDAARHLKEWAECYDDFHAWAKRCEAVGICHLPEKGEPAQVWWFGFDCSHCGDISPGYDFSRRHDFGPNEYRDVDYVRDQVAELAKQLHSLGGDASE